eukprot:jgi/Botrbrau1/21546/Bobra.174_2s0048.2
MLNNGSFHSASLQTSVMLPVESQSVDFQKALERARKLEVHGEFFLDNCSPLKDVSNIIQDDVTPIGKSLIEKLLQNVRSLEGRVVGRNKDDAQNILSGLEVLYKEWQNLHNVSKQAAQQCAEEAAAYVAEVQRLQNEPSPAGSKTCNSTSNDRLSQLLRENCELTAALKTEQEHRLKMEARLTNVQMELDAARQAKAFWEASAGNMSQESSYAMVGRVGLGETLRVLGPAGSQLPAQVQWFRSVGVSWEPIIGATRCQYSPEPSDVGTALACRLHPGSPSANPSTEPITLTSAQPVANLHGLEEYVQLLEAEGLGRFSVVVVQLNGVLQAHRQVCTLEISSQGICLIVDDCCALRRSFEEGMQVCGARGGGEAAAQGMFLAFPPLPVYMLVCPPPFLF